MRKRLGIICHMNTLYDSIEEAHIAELTRQRDALLKKVALLSEIVNKVPSIILNARLDQKQGIETKYDYAASSRALNAPQS